MTHETVLVLRDPGCPGTSLRCVAFGGFLQRRAAAGGDRAELVLHTAEPAAALAELAAAAGVLVDADEVAYVPTPGARDRVVRDEDGAWPKAVASRHRKAVRRTPGAVFRYPLEPAADTVGTADAVGDAGDEVPHAGPATSVDAFVTDWTGMPSACAVAVHPGHPLSPGLPAGEGAAFTGRYCRHPLTGDLLPVWVADWVKPEFGTGAVVLNPAHNRTDLEFARRVGLPVRFSLAPEGYDGSPGSWAQPPYVRSGVAVRAGTADGLPFEVAGNAHLRTAVERGLAEPWTDAGVGVFPVAAIRPDGDVELRTDPDRRTVAGAGTGTAGTAATAGTAIGLAASPILSVVEPRHRAGELTVVSPSTRVERDLLGLRLLLAEPGLEPPVKRAPEVVLVGNVAGLGDRASEDVLRLALLVGGGPLDTVALKPQQVEPCARFLAVHETLAHAATVAGRPASPDVVKAAGNVKACLVRGDLKQGFTRLYRLQKGLARSDDLGDEDLRHYLALAHVLAGVGCPCPDEVLVDVWRRL